jgi:ribosome-associated heat shock protein Hsp15
VRVAALADKHLPRAEARKLYEDLTPPPSPEEIELRRLERLSRPVIPAWGRDKRQRRLVRRLKGRDRL